MPLKALIEALGLLFGHQLRLYSCVLLGNILQKSISVANVNRAARDMLALQETTRVFGNLKVVFFLKLLGLSVAIVVLGCVCLGRCNLLELVADLRYREESHYDARLTISYVTPEDQGGLGRRPAVHLVLVW